MEQVLILENEIISKEINRIVFLLPSDHCLFFTASFGMRLLNGKSLVYVMIWFSTRSLVCQSPDCFAVLCLFYLRSRMLLSKTDSLFSVLWHVSVYE